MNQPRISLLMDVQEDGPDLDVAVGSVAAQGFSDWELVLAAVPRAVTAVERIRGRAESDERIRVLSLADDLGPGGALNYAAGHARGELVGYLEANAELAPDYLQKLVSITRAFDVLVCGYDVVLHDVEAMRGPPARGVLESHAGGPRPSPPAPVPGGEGGMDGAPVIVSWDPHAVRTQLFARSIVRRLGIVHRRDLFERAGGFNELVWDTPEWDLLKRFARLGADFLFVKLTAGAYHLRCAPTRGPEIGDVTSRWASQGSTHPTAGGAGEVAGPRPSPAAPLPGGEGGVGLGGHRAREVGEGWRRIERNRREGKPVFGERSGWMFPKTVERVLFASVHCLLDYTNGASLTVLQTLRWLNEHGLAPRAFCLCDHADPDRQHLGFEVKAPAVDPDLPVEPGAAPSVWQNDGRRDSGDRAARGAERSVAGDGGYAAVSRRLRKAADRAAPGSRHHLRWRLPEPGDDGGGQTPRHSRRLLAAQFRISERQRVPIRRPGGRAVGVFARVLLAGDRAGLHGDSEPD